MELIRQLVQNLIVIVVLAVFLEMLLPAGDMRRYVKMVMGLLIIVVVLQAIGGIVRGDWQRHLEPAINAASPGVPDLKEILAAGQRLKDGQEQKALEEYRQGLSRQIVALAGLNSEVQVVKARVEIYADPGDRRYGQIREVFLLLAAARPRIQEQGSGSRGEQLVEPVTINVGEGAQPVQGEVNAKPGPEAEKAAARLARVVADFYNLSPDQVKVQWVS
ncbi:stage III sporulation protein AF [Desulfofundulus thermocisternus]|uniref:stage III sporulation protein AF n=1 Tax=Desulfofundulus thermocisternus TaxID=42471 RepID=UPI00217E9C66|nr:stage III sporulation protein AF [Desulfofundulus thermocisternus]MCS5694797.1 stage III sporulation protein AF [Desulfofundulus thermocisternus]